MIKWCILGVVVGLCIHCAIHLIANLIDSLITKYKRAKCKGILTKIMLDKLYLV